jgi:hypothetical protein
MFCDKLCKTDADCLAGAKCTDEKLCEGFPVFSCSHVKDCPLADGHLGARCRADDACKNPCKPGLFQSKSGDCAKPCKADADCPEGRCEEGFCGPTCPAKACPYLWE